MISIGIGAIACHLGVDMSTALLSMLQCLQNNNTGTLAHNKTAAGCIKRTRSLLRIIIAVAAQSLHSTEASHSSRGNACLSTASQHNISITSLQHAESVTDVVSTGSTSSNNAAARSLQAKGNRHMTGSHIADHHRNEERADAGRPLIKELLILAVHGLNTANATAYIGTNALAILRLQIQLGILNSHLCRSYSKLSITVNALGLLLVHIISRLKILYLTGNLCLVLSCIKAGNFINTIFAGHHSIPKSILADTYRAYYTQTGNHNTIRQK